MFFKTVHIMKMLHMKMLQDYFKYEEIFILVRYYT